MNIQLTKGIAFERIDVDEKRPTIIFLHDSLGCIELWRNFPKDLGRVCNCNVIIYDRQGYGQSASFDNEERGLNYMELEADKLIELMNSWGLQDAILFGHSDGGSIAIIAAGKYPNRVKAIITEGAHVMVEDITLQGIYEAIEVYESTDLHTKLKKYHGEKTKSLFDAWSKTWTKPFFKNWNIEHFVQTMYCPSLIVQGEQDEYGSLKQVQSIVDNSKGPCTALILPKTKHTPHKERTEEVMSASATFIQSIVE